MEAEDSVDVLVRRRLRELRMQRGLTLEDVAQAARIDVSTLSRLESGKRRLARRSPHRVPTAFAVFYPLPTRGRRKPGVQSTDPGGDGAPSRLIGGKYSPNRVRCHHIRSCSSS